jgi:uncharacterized coiled-coil protein SlyX
MKCKIKLCKKDIISNDEAKENAILVAKAYTNSTKTAALTMLDAVGNLTNSKTDIKTLHEEIFKLTNNVLKGDISDLEVKLAAQANTLDFLFNNMVSRVSLSKNVDIMRAHMDMALRLQNQYRKTIQTIHTLKYPQHQTVVRQQNVAFNQQVNNGLSQAEPKLKCENELLELKDEWLDKRKDGASSSINSRLETLEICRSEVRKRQVSI